MPGADEGAHSPTLLHELLAEARALGFLGPGPLQPQIQHAQGFAAVGRRLSLEGRSASPTWARAVASPAS